MWACLSVLLCKVPCLLRLFSRFEELPERLSMELECVHWDRRDWGWGGSLRDRPPTSMQFTFMFGFSPAEHKTQESFVNICTNKNKFQTHNTTIHCLIHCVAHTTIRQKMQAFWQLHDFFFFFFLKSCWFIFTSHDTKSGATQAVIHNEGSSFISVSWENLSFKQSDHSVVLSAPCCC